MLGERRGAEASAGWGPCGWRLRAARAAAGATLQQARAAPCPAPLEPARTASPAPSRAGPPRRAGSPAAARRPAATAAAGTRRRAPRPWVGERRGLRGPRLIRHQCPPLKSPPGHLCAAPAAAAALLPFSGPRMPPPLARLASAPRLGQPLMPPKLYASVRSARRCGRKRRRQALGAEVGQQVGQEVVQAGPHFAAGLVWGAEGGGGRASRRGARRRGRQQ
jgi:hypothetical protein